MSEDNRKDKKRSSGFGIIVPDFVADITEAAGSMLDGLG